MKPGDLIRYHWAHAPNSRISGVVLQIVDQCIPGIKYSVEILQGDMRYWFDVWEDEEEFQKIEVVNEAQ